MAGIIPLDTKVYIVWGIDEFERDCVLGVFRENSDALQFLRSTEFSTEYYDLWLECHPLL